MKDNSYKTAAYCSLGCKVNQYDTDAMRQIMEKNGFTTVQFNEVADVYIINTCSVTHVSDRKSRQMISRAHTKSPDSLIVVAGCYAKTAPDVVAALDGVNIVLGTNERSQIADIILNYINENKTSAYTYQNDDSEFEDLSADESDKTRAYLKIQDGCNRFCSYCIIPYARGRIRSRSLESVKRELLKLSEHGYKEVVLTGIHLMSYGLDFGGKFDITDAIAQADDIDGIERIRLGSLEPLFITDDFVSKIAENKKVCRQFHMSLQSGCDSVLKRMNRHYTTDEFTCAVNKLREKMPDCAITTDIIGGFVGETEDEHRTTLDFISKIKFAKVHAFPYSVRKGTAAEKMQGHLPQEIKEKRTHDIINVAGKYQDEYIASHVGQIMKVLIEEPVNGGMRGYTDTYIDVHVNSDAKSNTIYNVYIDSANDKCLIGHIVD